MMKKVWFDWDSFAIGWGIGTIVTTIIIIALAQ